MTNTLESPGRAFRGHVRAAAVEARGMLASGVPAGSVARMAALELGVAYADLSSIVRGTLEKGLERWAQR